MKTIIIIPALNPEKYLLNLVEQINYLGKNGYPIVIVDDGSDEKSKALLHRLQQEYGCTILYHQVNQGKGAALKTAFYHIKKQWPDCNGCVSADADGQHRAKDILAIAHALEEDSASLILGSRDFFGKNVPFKSRWGNNISALLFRSLTGRDCPDTQTGLRGIPADFLDAFLQIPGSRFEYEMNMLFYAAKNDLPIKSIPIKTVYRDNNRHSHYKAIKDSIRVYSGFFRYGLSSLASAALDFSVFILLLAVLGKTAFIVFIATVFARMLSGVANFLINKLWVFKSKDRSLVESRKYLLLFLVQMLTSALFVGLLSAAIPATGAKILIDTLLFFISYFIQSRFIFKKNRQTSPISSKGGTL